VTAFHYFVIQSQRADDYIARQNLTPSAFVNYSFCQKKLKHGGHKEKKTPRVFQAFAEP